MDVAAESVILLMVVVGHKELTSIGLIGSNIHGIPRLPMVIVLIGLQPTIGSATFNDGGRKVTLCVVNATIHEMDLLGLLHCEYCRAEMCHTSTIYTRYCGQLASSEDLIQCSTMGLGSVL